MTQKLLIIDCSGSGHTLILKRSDMTVVANSELVSSTMGYSSHSIAVIEMGDFGDYAFNDAITAWNDNK